MYNWSVDEKKFRNIKEVVNFLQSQAEVVAVRILDKKDKYSNVVIKTRLKSKIHPAKKFFIAKILEEKVGEIKVSIIQEENQSSRMEKLFYRRGEKTQREDI